MKQLLLIFTAMCTVCFSTNGMTQTANAFGNTGYFAGGIGMTTIDEETYFSITLHPDIPLGKLGIGLNINLLYNTETGHIRSEDWDENYDWARLIRYIRYGHKRRDNFYTRIGTLDAARLGHGFLMNYYTNEASYDKRKIGLELDIDFGVWGFETVTSNLGRLEVIGGRGYIRPFTNSVEIPLIKNMAFGASFVTDVDPDGSRDSGDGIFSYGFDVEVPLLNIPMFNSFAYFDWAKIDTFGSGQAIGIEANLTIVAGIAEASARVERRWLGTKFESSYFNAFYEIQRFAPNENDSLVTKSYYLNQINEERQGVYGELMGHILNTVRIVGNFQRLDGVRHSGILHLAAEIPDAVPKIAAHAYYDRKNIESSRDLFTLDEENSIARVGIGYKIKPYLLLNMDYIYTFRFDEENNKYVAQKRFEPRISFVYNF